jgi:L-fucose mutarotase
MGHFDELVIADANYKASAMSSRIIHCGAEKNDELLDAVLKYFPLDEDGDNAINVMTPDHGYDHDPEIWSDYKRVLEKNEYSENMKLSKIPRGDFYERARAAYATIQTKDTRLYADVIIRKGFVVE